MVVRCGDGLVCTGVGTSGEPLVISWQVPLGSAACNAVMDCVGANLGSGLEYFPSAHRLAAKISTNAGNMLGFGTDGGLLVTGSPDPALGGVTIAGLPASNIVGSSYGAGFSVWPEGYLKSYEAAMQNENISIIQVPVRRGLDQQLFAVDNHDIGYYTGVSLPGWTIDSFDQMTSYPGTKVRPGGVPEALTGDIDDITYDPRSGYFGFAYPETQGLLMLEDVFRVTARRVCLYLECKDLGATNDTTVPLTTLTKMVKAVQKWGLQKSVIIAAQLPTTTADLAGLQAGLALARANGIEISVQLNTAAEAAAHSPASLITLGCTWVGCSYSLSSATIATYVAAGLKVMMFVADRQWHWDAQQSFGVRGAFCSDPVYTPANTYGFLYRRVNPPSTWPHSWSSTAPDYGRCGYSNTQAGNHAKLRGWVDRDSDSLGSPLGRLVAGPDMVPPTNSGFHIPMGEFCPVYDPALAVPPPAGVYGSPTNYDLEFGVSTTVVQGGGLLSMGVFFGAPKDVRMFDLTASTADTKGYTFYLASDGNLVFRRYDGVGGGFQYGLTWASGWGAMTAMRQYRLTVQVRPGTIRVGPSTENGGIGGANSRLFTSSSPSGAGGDMWRGPYFYMSFYRGSPYTGFIDYHTPKVVNY